MVPHFYFVFLFCRNPNGPDLVHWPQYDVKHAIQILGKPIKSQENILPKKRKFWLEEVPNILAGKETSSGSTNAGFKATGNGFVFTVILFISTLLI